MLQSKVTPGGITKHSGINGGVSVAWAVVLPLGSARAILSPSLVLALRILPRLFLLLHASPVSPPTTHDIAGAAKMLFSTRCACAACVRLWEWLMVVSFCSSLGIRMGAATQQLTLLCSSCKLRLSMLSSYSRLLVHGSAVNT